MTNFIESIKEGFSIIKEELEELDRRTDFNRLFLDKMLNKMNLLDDNADILEYLDVMTAMITMMMNAKNILASSASH